MKLWDILFPLVMYYAVITVGIALMQMVFGSGNEQYMLCKTIGAAAAIPVVFSFYKFDLILKGTYKLPWKPSVKKAWDLLLAMGISIFFSIGLNNIILMSPLYELSGGYGEASGSFYGGNIWLVFLASAVVTPILEELLHRAVIFGRLKRDLPVWAAVVVSSMIFAALHFNLVQFAYTLFLGMVFAVFAEKTGKLYPAIIGHMLANGIAILRTETGFLEGTLDKSPVAWIVSVGCLVLGLIGLFLYVMCEPKKEK